VVEDEVAAETPAGVEEAGSPASDDDATEVVDVAEETPEAPSEPEPEVSDDAKTPAE
jgi:hypothetical protein